MIPSMDGWMKPNSRKALMLCKMLVRTECNDLQISDFEKIKWSF